MVVILHSCHSFQWDLWRRIGLFPGYLQISFLSSRYWYMNKYIMTCYVYADILWEFVIGEEVRREQEVKAISLFLAHSSLSWKVPLASVCLSIYDSIISMQVWKMGWGGVPLLVFWVDLRGHCCWLAHLMFSARLASVVEKVWTTEFYKLCMFQTGKYATWT